jgi:nitrogen fixation NifU-like protein
VKGRTWEETEALFETFHRLVTEGPGEGVPPGLGKLAVFAGVFKYPARVKCASLAWHTLKAALAGKPPDPAAISTE